MRHSLPCDMFLPLLVSPACSVERCVEASTSELRPGRSGAFAVKIGGEETVAVVAELRSKQSMAAMANLVNDMKVACMREHGVALGVVLLCKVPPSFVAPTLRVCA